jgi:hypothetical protein
MFNPSKTRYNDLKAALLNPKFGFTTTSPLASTIVGGVDDSAADVDEGMQPQAASGIYPMARGPTVDPLTTAGDHNSNVDLGCSHGGAEPAAVVCLLICLSAIYL